MYIKELNLINFRGFKKGTKIQFTNDINVIVGANNSGKTTVIKALELLFSDNSSKKLAIDDFNHNTSVKELKENPPKIVISAKLIESEGEEEYSEDLITVSTWLTKIEKPYEATITYEFALPEKEEDEYKSIIGNLESKEIEDYWSEIETTFLRKYTSKIFIGNPEHRTLIDSDSIRKFDYQYLDAIRDVERDLFTGRNTLLKEVIDFYMDYDIKIDGELNKDDKHERILKRKKDFSKKADVLISDLHKRMSGGKKEMLKYAEETGADFDNITPSFDGKILDTELYSALRLVVENKTGIKLPATRNGLGYNNLIYISLLLAKMQKNASGEYMGNNAKVFPILAIEEPEAHLHPNMQYKFLKFLNENSKHEVRQIFITTHSPNITAAVDLDSIIVLYKDKAETKIAYPGKVFSESEEDQASKNYVGRFLDVTKADMFFAKSIIFVEGIAEQLLIPEFTKGIGLDLTDSHVSVINVNGRYFNHFLKLFDVNNSKYAIPKKIVCLTDMDPVMKKIKDESIEDDDENSSWKACFPFLVGSDETNYEYKKTSNSLTELYQGRDKKDLIRVYTQNEGSTFEYELMFENIKCVDLLTDSVANKNEIKYMMKKYHEEISMPEIKTMVKKIRKGKFKDSINSFLEKTQLEPSKIAKHIIAARYLNSIKKGEVAQELSYAISVNIQNKNSVDSKVKSTAFNFVTPMYISEAIKWICQ
ncbi:AAA family ATPase [Tissierella carlieri]|uniref:AAA family ATPase n=1 Tax=Tissierella carlieri TaxID=689904 RepID=A0ABT1S6Y6_9FIRM|nr:AAA family ATPase [Tissierella carlieri]MCQ4922239.1 AAA family ATPase [Tissierella carlieri]